MKTKKAGSSILAKNIEFILALLIVVCVVLSMMTVDYTIEYMGDRYSETLFIPDSYADVNDPELEKLIQEYQPNPAKMIEVYDENFDLAFRINFAEDSDDETYKNIKDFPKLMEYFTENREGHTYFKSSENKETDLYFRWYMVNNHQGPNGIEGDTEHLVLIFMTRPEAVSYLLNRLLSYAILVLAFTIVLVALRKQRDEKMRLLESNSKNISEAIYRD
ncbi:MAG: hypothetical protein HDQ88_10235 [Clostridia bacterium]|nr:hypothetical protein [Clostridia bacterium]